MIIMIMKEKSDFTGSLILPVTDVLLSSVNHCNVVITEE